MNRAVSPYLSDQLKPSLAKKTVRKVVKEIRRQNIWFDTIVFSGYSGSLIAPSVAMLLEKHMAFVRRETHHNHSGQKVETSGADIESFIIIDDIIEKGNTIKRIIDGIKNYAWYPDAKCVGVFLYDGGGSDRVVKELRAKGIPIFVL